MKLLVLAGGFGSRLRSVVAVVPKVLAPIGGTPFLSFLLSNWIRQGVRSFVFLLHYKSGEVINFLESEKEKTLVDCEVEYVIEDSPLGTGGSVAHAIRKLDISGPFLLANGDTWLFSGIEEISNSDLPSMCVVSLKGLNRYGSVTFDDNRRIVSFAEKTGDAESKWINGGLYKLSDKLFEDWDGSNYSIENELFPSLVEAKALGAIPVHSDFIDIGIPTDYFKFSRRMASDDQGKS